MEKSYQLGSPNYTNKIQGKEQDISTSLNTDTEPESPGTGSRIEFNTDNVRKQVYDRGINILWERGYICPCISKMTGSPNPICPYCHGVGISYQQPVKTRAIIQSQEKGLYNTDIGLLDTGTAILTSGFETRMGYRDRITVPEVQIPQQMVFYIDNRRIEQGVHFRYDVKEIEYITSYERVLTEDDYVVKNNKIYFNKEFDGSTVTMIVYCTLRYMIADLLKESRYQYTEFLQPDTKFENLPQKALLKREDVVVNPEPLTLDSNIDGEVKTEVEARINEPKLQSGESAKNSGFYGGLF